jgi:hypothetical protein
MIPKAEDFGGENTKLPLSYADIKGASAVLANAISSKGSSTTDAFEITHVKDYAVFSLDGDAIDLSIGKNNAWMPALDKEVASAFRALARRNAFGLYRDYIGDIAEVGSIATTTVTLAYREQHAMFEVDQTIMFVELAQKTSAALGPRESGTTVTIVTIDRDAGTIVTSADTTAWSDPVVATDLILPDGDHLARPSGFSGWVPAAAPGGGDSHFGIDRSLNDPVRMAGIRFDCTSMSIEEALINAAARQAEMAELPADTVFVSHLVYRKLINELGSRVHYVRGYARFNTPKGNKLDGSIGFTGVRVITNTGVLDVYPDRYCQTHDGWMLRLDTWKFWSAGKAPKWLDKDGNRLRAEASADQYTGRLGEYFQICCDAPGYNVRMTNLGT